MPNKLFRIINSFRLFDEKEEPEKVIADISQGVVFRGTNLWILVFAIFIASLGLNVNSTAVIIGAMLVSPLMGPIMGLGLAMGVNDLSLLRKALYNYLFATGVALCTSTLYFAITPINDAHSEILARTSPNIYDVLIALFGGLAGILAISSKKKGNVLPGVAIATALMPPLCTAGYGLATLQFNFFFGAFYLFFINTVFIALATLLTVRILKFPFKEQLDPRASRRTKRVIGGVVLITLLPSIYFGFDIVQRGKFYANANRFVELEAVFPNDYLLKKEVDPKEQRIVLTYGGALIDSVEISKLQAKLPLYGLQDAQLEIQQGFAYLYENKPDPQQTQLSAALAAKERELSRLRQQLDSLQVPSSLSRQVLAELGVQYPLVKGLALQPATMVEDSLQLPVYLVIIQHEADIPKKEQQMIQDWLEIRLNKTNLELVFQRL